MDGKGDGRDGKENTPVVKRDSTYFFPQDFIVLKVEDTLFRVHLFQLLKHSEYLISLLFEYSEPAEGFSEANPFVVQDITVTEFRHFLRIILPSVTENLERLWSNKNAVLKNEWLSILKISTLWRCLRLRRLAISALDANAQLTSTEKVELGRKYTISRWVEVGYTELVRKGGLTDKEMESIGAVTSSKLLRIMLEVQQQPRMSAYVDKRVKDVFEPELRSISAAELTYTVTHRPITSRQKPAVTEEASQCRLV